MNYVGTTLGGKLVAADADGNVFADGVKVGDGLKSDGGRLTFVALPDDAHRKWVLGLKAGNFIEGNAGMEGWKRVRVTRIEMPFGGGLKVWGVADGETLELANDQRGVRPLQVGVGTEKGSDVTVQTPANHDELRRYMEMIMGGGSKRAPHEMGAPQFGMPAPSRTWTKAARDTLTKASDVTISTWTKPMYVPVEAFAGLPKMGFPKAFTTARDGMFGTRVPVATRAAVETAVDGALSRALPIGMKRPCLVWDDGDVVPKSKLDEALGKVAGLEADHAKRRETWKRQVDHLVGEAERDRLKLAEANATITALRASLEQAVRQLGGHGEARERGAGLMSENVAMLGRWGR